MGLLLSMFAAGKRGDAIGFVHLYSGDAACVV